MLTIYKYKIEGSYTEVHADVIQWLNIDWQEREGSFVAWALVDPEGPQRCFLIRLVETGEYLGDTELEGYGYLGSVNLNIYVSHFFVAEVNPKTKELLKDNDNNYEPFTNKELNENKDFNFTWSPDHLSWLDPNVLENFFKEEGNWLNNYEK